MSAWSKDITEAHKDRQILFRHPDWDCPVVVHWTTEHDEAGDWIFSESIIADIDGGLLDVEATGPGLEWAPLPE